MNARPDDHEASWSARPWVARFIRAFVFVVPIAISVAAAWAISTVAPKAESFGWGVARWAAIAAVSTVVLVFVEKAARRLLPLATLFGLTLAFPDEAPSRFQLPIRKGSTTQLRTLVAEARAGKLGDTPADAAERVLELVMALSVHDRLTRGHSERVRAYTQLIGEQMGLTARELDRIRWAGLLHDIGKLMISGDILNKTSKLTDDEFETIKLHPEFGRKLVAPLAEWMGDAARAVWEHHERWDGDGYPRGLASTDISLAGRIVAVADAYDVMTSARSYKKPVSSAAARAELARCSGTQFDPAVVRAFLNLSIGRLRHTMGPLSWLAQLPLLPGAVVASATQASVSATALVGAAAASAGVGLAGEPVLPMSDPVVAESPGYGDDRLVGSDGESSIVVTFPPLEPAGDRGIQRVDDQSAEPSNGGDGTPLRAGGGEAQPPTGDSSTTTTVAPRAGVDAPTIVPTSTTAGTSTRSVTTSTASPTTTTAPAGSGSVTSTIATTSTTGPTTTAATTSTTTLPTATTTPRPGWIPPAGEPAPLFLTMSGKIDLASMPVVALSLTPPSKPNTHGLDPDKDSRVGVTLPRLDGPDPQPERAASFGWGGPDQARVSGNAGAVVFIGAASNDPVAIVVRAQVVICDGSTSSAACTNVASRITALAVAADPIEVSFDFGRIDALIPAQGTIRLVLDVPAESSSDAVLVAGAATAPSALTLVFA